MWYLIKEGGIYYAERKDHKGRKVRFKDWNGHDLSLSGEEEWAQSWVNARNEIENINHF